MKRFEYLLPKLFSVMGNYNASQLGKDLVSGIIVAIIALPLSIALAIASGVNPEQGLYTAIVAGFFISFLGGSRVQIGGPTAAFVVIIYGIIAGYGFDGLVAATLLAGIIMVFMGIMKIGSLIRFIPRTITEGFTMGIAVGIFVGQLKDFFGLEMGAVPAEFFEKLLAYGEHFHTFKPMTLLIGVIAILVQIFWPRVSRKIPGSLIAILLTTAMVNLLNMPVTTIGDLYTIRAGFPEFHAPELSLPLIRTMLSPALTIAILASIESLLSAVVADGMIGDKHKSNAELMAQGIANIFSALFGGIPATGAIARTAANVKNGGRTPVAGMVHALTLLLILLFLMPYASLIPMSTLAAILIMVAYNMSGWRGFVHMLRTAPKSDAFVLLLTFLLTVFFDLVIAIEVGMVLAAFLFMKRMSDITDVKAWIDPAEHTEAEGSDISELRDIPAGTMVYEIAGPMFFGAAADYLGFTRQKDKSVLILRMGKVPAMDISGLGALEEIYEICRRERICLLLSHVNPQPMRVMEKAGFTERLGRNNLLPSISEALKRAEELSG